MKFDYNRTWSRPDSLVKSYFMIKYGLKEMKQKLEDNELIYIKTAAFFGQLDILIYLHNYGCPWNEECCKLASLNGRIKVLKYLQEKGCQEGNLLALLRSCCF